MLPLGLKGPFLTIFVFTGLIEQAMFLTNRSWSLTTGFGTIMSGPHDSQPNSIMIDIEFSSLDEAAVDTH